MGCAVAARRAGFWFCLAVPSRLSFMLRCIFALLSVELLSLLMTSFGIGRWRCGFC